MKQAGLHMEMCSHSHGGRKAQGHQFLKVACRSGTWKTLTRGRKDNYKGNPPARPATGAQQIPGAVLQQLSQPQRRENLHLHELKDLSDEHTGEAILLMQVIDVKPTVKENNLQTPSL